MSPRIHAPFPTWEACHGHSATVYHMPTMRALGCRWDILAACQRESCDPGTLPGSWPDTEVNVSLDLLQRRRYPAWLLSPEAEGWSTLFVGDEPNAPYSTALLRHERVGATVMVYSRGTDEGRLRKAALEHQASLVPARLAEWRDHPPGKTLLEVLPEIKSCPFAGPACGDGKRDCSKLCRSVSLDDCFACKLGPPLGEVIQSIGYDWLGEPPQDTNG